MAVRSDLGLKAYDSAENSKTSTLHLPRRLVDADADRERLAGSAPLRPAHRRRAEIIETDGDPQMLVRRADAVSRVESDPAQIGNQRLRPGVAGVLFGHPIGAAEVAADIACRNLQ